MKVAAEQAGQGSDQPRFNADLKLHHVLSCDSDSRVQTWILRTHDPKIFTKELKECSDPVIFDEKSKEFVVAQPKAQARLHRCKDWSNRPDLPLVHRVTGIMSSGEDGNSNHQNVLQKFDEIGYEVCHAVVCPSKMGLPMTRRRVYYQGLNRNKVENAKDQIALLSSTWQGLIDNTYEKFSLDMFLDCEGGIPNTNSSSERDRTDRKWDIDAAMNKYANCEAFMKLTMREREIIAFLDVVCPLLAEPGEQIVEESVDVSLGLSGVL
eukprot:Skav205767  [mRNA]  locus=scaffold1714:451656:454268:- [translate_table: standard]